MLSTPAIADHGTRRAANVIIPLIRMAATIGFAISPCSLGFVIIAVSDHLIRAIMVGEDPVMLVSDLQNHFPDHALEVSDASHGVVAQVAGMIDQPESAVRLPLDTLNGVEIRC